MEQKESAEIMRGATKNIKACIEVDETGRAIGIDMLPMFDGTAEPVNIGGNVFPSQEPKRDKAKQKAKRKEAYRQRKQNRRR